MSIINNVVGKKYRILQDPINKIWDQISFWTSSRDVECDDGLTVEDKIGDMKGLVTTPQTIPGYVLDASVTAYAPKVFNGTLRSGSTPKLTFTDPVITSTAKVSVYTDVWGFSPTSAVVSGHTLTINFPAPSSVVNVKVEVVEFTS